MLKLAQRADHINMFHIVEVGENAPLESAGATLEITSASKLIHASAWFSALRNFGAKFRREAMRRRGLGASHNRVPATVAFKEGKTLIGEVTTGNVLRNEPPEADLTEENEDTKR